MKTGWDKRALSKIKNAAYLKILLGLLGLIILISLLAAKFPHNQAVSLFYLALFALGLILLILFYQGTDVIKMTGLYLKMVDLSKERSSISLNALAKELRLELKKLSKVLFRLMDLKVIDPDCLSLERKELLFEPEAKALLPESPTTQLREKLVRPLEPLGFFSLTWLLYFLTFPYTGLFSVLIAAIISAVILFVALKAFPPVKILVEEAKYDSAYALELSTFTLTATAQADKLLELKKSLANPQIIDSLGKIIDLSKQIFDFGITNPDKLANLRQFVNYYLPTTIQLLEDYREMEAYEEKSDNVLRTMTKIQDMMGGLINSFKQELDALYGDKTFNIAVEIKVLQSLIKEDNLLESSKYEINKGGGENGR